MLFRSQICGTGPDFTVASCKKACTFNLTLREEVMETSVPLFLTSPGTSNEIPQPQNESNADCVVCFSWSLTQNLTAPFYNLRYKKNSSITHAATSIIFEVEFLINTEQWRIFSPFAPHTDSVFFAILLLCFSVKTCRNQVFCMCLSSQTAVLFIV